jgi:hypothetical protein
VNCPKGVSGGVVGIGYWVLERALPFTCLCGKCVLLAPFGLKVEVLEA